MPTGRATSPHIVDRIALTDRIDARPGSTLISVIAPAGSGKSVLVSQWVATHPDANVVWLDLTPADDDPVHFSRRLLSGLAHADPTVAELAELVPIGTAGLGRPLVDALAMHLLGAGETIVVLDDLHVLSNEQLVADIAELVAVLPREVRVVLASRAELPFVLRRSSPAELVEIGRADLAMSFADTSEMLKRVTGRTITTTNVRTLIEKTEGWVAGLVLAGVSLRGREDADSYVTQFAGSDRRVAEYLGEEVLAAQSPQRRAALLRMAVLDAMSAELVAALFADPVAADLFAELERNSIFLVEVDDRAGWQRFHHLFGSLLRARLRVEDPAAEQRILRAAAQWHLERAETPPAVEYLLRARDDDRALDVILDQGPAVFERGEMATVVRWIGRVPEAVLARRPDVVTISGILTGLDGHADEADDILRRIVAAADTPFGLVVCAQAFIASLAQWRPRPATSLRHAKRALELLDELGDAPTPDLLHLSDPRLLRTTTLFSGGRSLFLLGDMDGARAWLDRALQSEGASYSLWRISALGSLALVEAWCGRTVLADELAREALGVARNVGSLAHPSIADAYLALTLTALEAGDRGRAALWLNEGRARAAGNGRTQLLWVVHQLHAALAGADTASAMGEIARPDGPPPPVVADRLLADANRRLRLHGRSGEIRWPEGRPADPAGASYLEFHLEELDRGVATPPEVRAVLLPNASDERMPRLAVQRRLARAREASLRNDAGEANRLLREAVAIAQPHRLVELFAQAGPQIIDRVRTSGIAPDFRQAILDSWERKGGAAAGPAVDPMPVALTVRELQVLPYLPTHISNAELAEELFVSVNTVKTHIAHIYDKLGVSGRGEAVRRAQALGLL